jgi:flagellar basal-body rod protein FlgG
MSVQTLYNAATGMQSMETKLDVIANNLANVQTTGFKKDRASFEDNFYRNEILPGSLDNAGNRTAIGVHIGMGSRVSGVQSNFVQGAFEQTDDPYDVAIEGHGFFQVQDPGSGQTYYTRAGNFSVNADGRLVMGSASTGRPLEPPIDIPLDTVDISIAPSGEVMVRQPGQTSFTQVGQIELATFVNPEGLLKMGENLYSQTDASGQALNGPPQLDGRGQLRQGNLEASNVEPVRELIDLITTQRSFEMNSQAIKAGDQMLELVSNLRRF